TDEANRKSLEIPIATTTSLSDEGRTKKSVSSEDDSGSETKLTPLKASPTLKSGRNNDGSDLNAIAVNHSMQINDKCANDYVGDLKDDKIVDLNFHHCPTNPTNSERNIDLMFNHMIVEKEQTYRPDLYDHCYITLSESSINLLEKSPLARNRLTIDKSVCRSAKKENRRNEKKQAFQNIFDSFSSSSRVVKDLLCKEQPPRQPVVTFKPRDIVRETEILYKFLVDGIDNEDIRLLKLAYEKLTSEEAPYIDWMKVMHWAPHVATFVSQTHVNRKRKRNGSLDENLGTVHHTGSARTEGYYKVHKVKRGFLATARQATAFEQLPSSL
uniref:COMPASS complex Set1 subunit N-SET domain-containing protein n=1 Tax=Romanomermis culicivorax TaxID=13658 RepID=A0A915L4W6_ROMCU